ncbi:MAG: Ig-like domain-containing protein [Verrucomicrobiota bacterium]
MVAVIAGIGLLLALNAKGTTEEARLASQMHSLNSAIQIYLASGGDLSGVSDPAVVLTKLKSRATAEQAEQLVGLRDAVVDPRLKFVMMSASEEAGGGERVLWNAANQRFEIATSGAGGIKQLVLDSNIGLDTQSTENRKMPVRMAKVDSWVWDYTEVPIAGWGTPGSESTAPGNAPPGTTGAGGDGGSLAGGPLPGGGPGGSTPGGDPDGPGASGSGVKILQAPHFSVQTGNYASESYPLEVALTDPNGEGLAEIHYSLNDSPWTLYEGPLGVSANSRLSAYCKSIDEGHSDSISVTEYYEAWDHRFSGIVTAQFGCAEGGPTMTVGYSDGETGSAFEFGMPAEGFSTGSLLNFRGQGFNDIRPGQIFRLGTLDYFNGTIWSGTEAERVLLELRLRLTNPVSETGFRYAFELVSTVNQGNSADEDADFVYIPRLSTPFSTTLNGVTYFLELQFGYQGEDGFSSIDTFHVHEGSGAQGMVYGKFTTAPSDHSGLQEEDSLVCAELGDAVEEEPSDQEEQPEQAASGHPCRESQHPADWPAYQDLDLIWETHVNGQGSTKWRVDNPNNVPLDSNPDSKVRYNWYSYSDYHATGTVVQSASAWDNQDPNPLDTAYAKSMKLEWYLVVDGNTSPILGCVIANADGVPLESDLPSQHELSFLSPAEGDEFAEGVDLLVEVLAEDSDGVARVDFFLNDEFVRSEENAPYVWNSADEALRDLQAGEYLLTAEVWDALGNTGEKEIRVSVLEDTTSDTELSFLTPLDGEKFAHQSDLSVEVAASDPEGIARVSLYLNENFIRTEHYAPYDWSSTEDSVLQNLSGGPHVFRAEAEDGEGNVTSTEIVVTIFEPEGEVPAVIFALPSTGELFQEGETLEVEVSASDDDGIASVQLYLNDALVRQEVAAPYEWGADDLALEDLAAGEYVLRAVATDSEGETSSAEIVVSVEEATTGGSYDGYAYQDLEVEWVRHHGQGSSQWRIINPNSSPLQSNPEVKLRYNWKVYRFPHLNGRVRQSGNGWDNPNPNPLNSSYGRSIRVEWYLVIDGEATEILGETTARDEP